MAEPTILLTGATDGIGAAAARMLSEKRGRVVLHGRNPDKLAKVVERLPGSPERILGDLSSLAEVRRLAEEIDARFDRLDVVIHNAGIGDERETSPDGFDLTMAVNYLAPFALTGLLFEKLVKSRAKIVNVASMAQSPFDFGDPGLTRGRSGGSYGMSKLAMIMWTFELAARTQAVRAVALHPGTLLDTQLVRRHYGRSLASADEGGEAVTYLAVSDETADATGIYFNQKRRAEPSAAAHDVEARQTLWKASEAATGVAFPF